MYSYKNKIETNASNNIKMKGIINVGSTCYLNTAIQCLYNCDHFKSFVENTEPSQSAPLFNSLHDLFTSLENSTSAVKPYKFIEQVHKSFGNIIDVREQNDINEFYSLLIDKLNACISQRKSVPSLEELIATGGYKLKTPYDRMKLKIDNAWLQSHCREYSKLLNVLYGQSISQVECGCCGKVHHNYEVFTSLSLHVPRGEQTLKQALKENFGDSPINEPGQDKWKCDKCHKSYPSVQTSKIWRLPKTLVITIKRFDHNLKKNDSLIDIPRHLDMTPYTLSEETPTHYDLKAVAFHIGSFYGGHYFALTLKPDKVYHIDDDFVRTVVDDEDMNNYLKTGYVFFYER